jgi:hypothetical protein
MGRVLKVDEHYVTVRFGEEDVQWIPAGTHGFQRL